MSGGVGLSRIMPARARILIIIGLMIVWLLPNVQQLTRRFKPVLCEVGEIKVSRLQWRFNASYAWVAGLVFVLSLSFLSRVRDFLYFQF